MCGIIAYTGSQDAVPVLLAGLRSLEYRGYDSAGVAIFDDRANMTVVKTAGRVAALAESLNSRRLRGSVGIGHTRWATHGAVNEANCHPHTSCDGGVAIVHNGIVENYVALRKELVATGHTFRSETDSEVIAHLLESLIAAGDSLVEAVRKSARRIQGAAAVVAASVTEPGEIVGLRLGNAGGIVAGFGDDGNLLASDLLALLPHTNRVAYLESGELVSVTAERISFQNLAGRKIDKPPVETDRSYEAAVRGSYPHFMAKEIHEQPESVTNAMRGRVNFGAGTVDLPGFPLDKADISALRQVVLVGMGTSLHAAMMGSHLVESLACIPSRAENASEFRYRGPVIDERTLVVSVSQSGETADTLAAMEGAALCNARQITVAEVEGSQATRMAEATLFIRAGQEIGVAATKTMANSAVVLYLLALYLAKVRGSLNQKAEKQAVDELAALPGMLSDLLRAEDRYKDLATRISHKEHLLYLGRGPMLPTALEGALKMKEIAYIHAEGYAAGEMKHGVNALISDAMPTIALAPSDRLHNKMVSNVNEVKARGGEVIALVTEGDEVIPGIADAVIYLPRASEAITPILALVPLQLLAYHTAVQLGHDPDKPRNLAKTVTVE